MSSAVSENALAYAAVLAWTAHLDHLNTSFETIAASSSSSMEKTCWAEELSIGIRVIRNYAMRTLADQYISKDTTQNPGFSNGLLAVLGPSQPSPNVSSTIEQILENIDDSPKFNNPLDVDANIIEKLYVTLKTAILQTLGIVPPPEEEFSTLISKVLANYLSSQQPNLASVNAFEGLAADTTTYLKGDSPAPCEWKDVFSTFTSLLQYHIHILSASAPEQGSTTRKVSELREKGNNLMTTTCYPQAIQVYTDGIYACDHTSRSHLPQLYTNRAIAYIGLNCFPEAVTDLQHALQYDRTFVPAWSQLGYCQLYLGSTMLALKCYLASLRSLSGEIYPYNYPVDEKIRHEYTEAKASTVMPQFVQKLVSSLLLAVRRAEQQREPASSLQEITTRVRAILARLRAHVQPDEVHFLSYSPDPDAESLRSAAVRADTVRPSILTPDVAQDIMASANVEASAVTMNGGPQARPDIPIPIVPGVTTTRTTTGPGFTTTRTTSGSGGPGPRGPAAPAGLVPGIPPMGFMGRSMGDILNTVGDVMNDAMQTSASPSPQPQSRDNADSRDPSDGNQGPQGTTTNADPQPPTSHIARAFSTIQRAYNLAQQGAGAISQANDQNRQAPQGPGPQVSPNPQGPQTAQQPQPQPPQPHQPQPPQPHQHPQNPHIIHNPHIPNNPHHAGIMEAAMRQHQAAVERMLNARTGNPATPTNAGPTPVPGHVRVVHHQGSTPGTPFSQTTTSTQNQQPRSATPNRASPGAEDTDMPDAPDLD